MKVPSSALHRVDVFHRDGAAVTEEDDQDGKADRGLRRGDCEYEKCKDLTDEVAQNRGERNKIDVHRKQDELDRHQDDDDVLPVEENAKDAEREQHRRDGQKMCNTDFHDYIPSPVSTLRISIAVLPDLATWSAMFWRLTRGLWR